MQSGPFKGKMIVVESMMDQDAFPWQPDDIGPKRKPRSEINFTIISAYGLKNEQDSTLCKTKRRQLASVVLYV